MSVIYTETLKAENLTDRHRIYDYMEDGARLTADDDTAITHTWRHGPLVTVLTARGYVEYDANEDVTITKYAHPVFGPGRPEAALAAINELAAAEAPLTGWSDYDTPTMRARYTKAKEARSYYSEYGTSYDDHAREMHK